MDSEFLPEAEEEFREATRYYETEALGAGVAFCITISQPTRQDCRLTLGYAREIRETRNAIFTISKSFSGSC